MLISRERSQLLVVDVQERLVPAIFDVERVVTNVARLIRYASLLHIPTTYTEHMPEQIGNVLPELSQTIGDSASIIKKKTFSAVREPKFSDRLVKLRQRGRGSIVVCGMEAHVCVMQTVLDLMSQGFELYLAVDAVGSRFDLDHQMALRRMESSGATLTTTESAIFEWCETSRNPAFKSISQIIQRTFS